MVRMSFPRPIESPIIEGDDPNWNEPPYLEDFEVDPDPGLPSDGFTFSVTYIDERGRSRIRQSRARR